MAAGCCAQNSKLAMADWTIYSPQIDFARVPLLGKLIYCRKVFAKSSKALFYDFDEWYWTQFRIVSSFFHAPSDERRFGLAFFYRDQPHATV